MTERTLFDFRDTSAWASVDDPVMGGLSTSALQRSPAGVGVFSGVVSLENSGGFASARAEMDPLDLSAYDGLRLRVRGDGKQYGLNVRSPESPSYRGYFVAQDDWAVVEFAFADLQPVRRGKVVDAAPLDTSQIVMVGFIITGKQAGPFRLEIERIDAFAV